MGFQRFEAFLAFNHAIQREGFRDVEKGYPCVVSVRVEIDLFVGKALAMRSMKSRFILRAAALMVLAGVSSVQAAAVSGPPTTLPALGINIKAQGVENRPGHAQPEQDDFSPPGLEIAGGLFSTHGTHTAPGRWEATWEVEGDPDPFLNLTFSVQNLMPIAQNFTATITLPIFPALTNGTFTGGSVSGTILDLNGNGGVLTHHTSGDPIYQSQLDGVDWQSLLNAPQSIPVAAFGTSAFGPVFFGGPPLPNLPGPLALNASMTIELNFRLSPGDFAAIVATLVVEENEAIVPEPTTLALVGFSLLGFCGRRRSNR